MSLLEKPAGEQTSPLQRRITYSSADFVDLLDMGFTNGSTYNRSVMVYLQVRRKKAQKVRVDVVPGPKRS